MHIRSQALTGLIASVTLLAVALAAAAAFIWSDEDIAFLVLLGAATVASEATDFHPFKGSRVSVSMALIFTAGVFSGLPGAVIVAVLAAASDAIFHRKAYYKAAFNIGALVVTAAVFVGVLEAFSPLFDSRDWVAMTGPAMAAAAVGYAVNSGLVAAAISLDSGCKLREAWAGAFRWLAPYSVLMGLVAVFAAMAYDRWGVSGLALSVVPLATLWLVMKSYSDSAGASTPSPPAPVTDLPVAG